MTHAAVLPAFASSLKHNTLVMSDAHSSAFNAFGSFTDSGYLSKMQEGRADSSVRRPVGSVPHILLMGSRRSGKTSIQRVVFNKTSPHETLFLDATQTLDRKYVGGQQTSLLTKADSVVLLASCAGVQVFFGGRRLWLMLAGLLAGWLVG